MNEEERFAYETEHDELIKKILATINSILKIT